MKKIGIIIIACILVAGCQSVGSGLEKETVLIVEQYLESSAALNWPKVFETLTGEALAQTKANYTRVKTSDNIITKKLTAVPFAKDIVTVTADVTKKVGENTDRQAYTFWLRKANERWQIYKTEQGQYQHGDLKEGDLPQGAMQVIKEYIELPFNKKKSLAERYLAGRLLQESAKSKTLPVDNKTIVEQKQIAINLKSIDCIGLTGGLAVAKVEYITTRDGMDYPAQALFEVIDVNGTWKISKIDII